MAWGAGPPRGHRRGTVRRGRRRTRPMPGRRTRRPGALRKRGDGDRPGTRNRARAPGRRRRASRPPVHLHPAPAGPAQRRAPPARGSSATPSGRRGRVHPRQRGPVRRGTLLGGRRPAPRHVDGYAPGAHLPAPSPGDGRVHRLQGVRQRRRRGGARPPGRGGVRATRPRHLRPHTLRLRRDAYATWPATRWGADPFAGGAYAAWPPGKVAAYRAACGAAGRGACASPASMLAKHRVWRARSAPARGLRRPYSRTWS